MIVIKSIINFITIFLAIYTFIALCMAKVLIIDKETYSNKFYARMLSDKFTFTYVIITTITIFIVPYFSISNTVVWVVGMATGIFYIAIEKSVYNKHVGRLD